MISDINAIWKPLADYALANDCDVARFDNAELVQECLYKQAQLLVSLDKGMEEEVEAQVVGCSSVMGWGLVKFREGGGGQVPRRRWCVWQPNGANTGEGCADLGASICSEAA